MEGEKAPRLAFAVRAEGERAVLSLRDHGAGIPADALERIFDPFFTTKEVGEGLGLGLSISYNIVKDFDGVLRAENHPQSGAVFTIELPLLPVKPLAARVALKEPALARGPFTHHKVVPWVVPTPFPVHIPPSPQHNLPPQF